MNYTIRSIKGTETITGTATDAVRAALAHDEELQPGFGTTIEITRGEIAGWEVLSLGDGAAREAIELHLEALREEAADLEGEERYLIGKRIHACEDALEGDESALVRVLVEIVEANVAEVLAPAA